MKNLSLIFILLFIVSSCVPNKNLVYLQGDPISNKQIRKLNNEPYKLRVNDIIHIDIKSTNDKLVSFFRKKEGAGNNNMNGQNSAQGFFNGYTVDRHGNVRLPYLGEINVLGYTTKEVRNKVESKLSEMFTSEDEYFVTVKLDGIRYTVMGEVGSPGPKIIFQNQVSILEAITNAGDITLTGNRKNVQVVRFTPGGTKKFEIDLTSINSLDSEVFYIQPNDYINVTPLKQKSWGTGTTGLQTITTIVSVFSLVTSTILIVRGL